MGNAGNAGGSNQPGLQLGKLAESRVNDILDLAHLGGDVISGVLDQLFAHDFSFPGGSRRSGCRSDLTVGPWSPLKPASP